MDDLLKKPFSGGQPVHFPYPRDFLCARPIFPTLILDGGASFFAADYLGSLNSDDWLPKIMDGSVLDYWTREGEVDFFSVFRDFRATAYTPEYEGHIWINRLYILLPLAQKYAQTHEEQYARRWLELLRLWVGQCPYTDYSDRPNDLVWRDMQVTWRCLVLLYSLFFFDDCPCFTEEDWAFIYASLKTHAEEMLREGQKYALITTPDNHRLQISAVLTMFGVLYPEFFDTDAYLTPAKTILDVNRETSIFADGCNNEDSPSYSHFNARLYLETYLTLTKNGLAPWPGLKETVGKQYEFLYHFSSPSGQTLTVGDSYALDAVSDIAAVEKLFPLSFSRTRSSRVFEPSRMAVLRSGRFALYVDAMDMTEWHQHFGRPHFLLYADSLPLIIDRGGVNYDRGSLRRIHVSAKAHNVIECEEIGLKKMPSNESLKLVDYDLSSPVQRLTIENRVTGEDGAWYIWTRTFALSEEQLEITDHVIADRERRFVSRLHLTSARTGYFDNTPENQPEMPREVRLRFGSYMERILTEDEYETAFVPCQTEKNRMDYAQVVLRRRKAKEFTEHTVIRFDKIR